MAQLVKGRFLSGLPWWKMVKTQEHSKRKSEDSTPTRISGEFYSWASQHINLFWQPEIAVRGSADKPTTWMWNQGETTKLFSQEWVYERLTNLECKSKMSMNVTPVIELNNLWRVFYVASRLPPRLKDAWKGYFLAAIVSSDL